MFQFKSFVILRDPIHPWTESNEKAKQVGPQSVLLATNQRERGLTAEGIFGKLKSKQTFLCLLAFGSQLFKYTYKPKITFLGLTEDCSVEHSNLSPSM